MSHLLFSLFSGTIQSIHDVEFYLFSAVPTSIDCSSSVVLKQFSFNPLIGRTLLKWQLVQFQKGNDCLHCISVYMCLFCHVCIPTIISKWKPVISKRQQLSALFLCFPPSTCFPQSLKPRFTRIFLSFLRVSNFSTKLSGQLLLLCLPSKSILSSQLVLIFSKSILPRQAQLVLIWKLFKQIFEFQFFASKFTFETLFTWLFEQFLFLSKSFSILLQNWRFKHCLLPRQTS